MCIAWKDRSRNDLYFVGRDVKPYSLTRDICGVLLASQIRKKEDMQAQYKCKIVRLQTELEELRQQQSSTSTTGPTSQADDQQQHQQQQSACTQPPFPSQLRLYIDKLERHEDRHMKVIDAF